MKVAVYSREIPKDRLQMFEQLTLALKNGGARLVFCGPAFGSGSDLPEDVELLLSLGGDGTFLEAVTFVRNRQIPVAGINFGHLGFLTTAKMGPSGTSWVDALLAGRYTVETRDLLKLSGASVPKDCYPYAVNEITLHRQGASMLSINLSVDGRPLPAYWADGIVIATSTGSTAYSLSVGGPVVLPSSKVLIIAPIAPHNLNVRPLVVPDDCSFELTFETRDREARMTLDNRSFGVTAGDRFRITKGEYGFEYAALSDDNFISALKTKLFWGEDLRNSK